MVVLANIFQPLIDFFESILVFIHDTSGVGWGMSIIALTLVVRATLVPLTYRQFRSMQALQQLAPEIKALQERYKDDKQRLNQEMMKFYSENKVNPLGSCLPLLLQMPVFLSLFYMLREDLKLDICPGVEAFAKQAGKSVSSVRCEQVDPGSGQFLFIPDLTAKGTGATLAVLIVLYIGSQLASSLLTPIADKNQKRLMVALPLVFVTFIISFPTGLIVYWITTNLWTVGQQQILRRRFGGAAGPGGAVPRASSPAPVAAGGAAAAVAVKPPPSARKKKKRSGRRR